MKIGIIGGGIIGLTSGVVLAEAGHEVQIFTQAPIEAVTSWAAGAVCYPSACEESERTYDWFEQSHRCLQSLVDTQGTGVYWAENWRKLSIQDQCEKPFWLERQGGKMLSASECELPYRSGISAKLIIMAIQTYVPYMKTRLKAAGGRYDIRAIAAPLEIAPDYDALVNATGIYAHQFSADFSVYPARGQVVIVKNPGVKKYISLFDKKFYFYPRGDQVLIGGSFDENEWDCKPDENLTNEILEWVASVEPLLKNPEIIDVRVGLRPMRPTVRLEREILKNGTPLIHNYGHGGAGYTLSWGCAFEVLKLLDAA
jgi:D-amino-acid oxidase